MASPPESDEPSVSDASLLASAWNGLEGNLERERGLGGRLKRLPEPTRRAMALVIALAFPAFALAIAPRSDLGTVSVAHAVVWSLVLAALAVAGTLVATRPLQARALEGSIAPALTVGAGLGAGVLVLLPLGAGGSAEPVLHGPGGCVAISLLVGALAFVIVWAMRRDAIGAAVGASLVASATAFSTTGIVCPIDAIVHMAPGHALPAVLIVAVGVALDRRGRAPA